MQGGEGDLLACRAGSEAPGTTKGGHEGHFIGVLGPGNLREK